MTLPIPVKTWIISPNNRIAYVSLNDMMAMYLFGVKQFLVANGYTVRGSSNGITGAMDLTDRWVTFANVTTRGTVAGSAQSWIVLRDGNDVDILLTYQGATDDVARISFSVGNLFIAAGTPQNQPTATDEQVVLSAVSIISSSTNADRLWFGWVSSDRKMCRFAIARFGIWVGNMWGVEAVQSSVVTTLLDPSSGVVFSPKVWGFGLSPTINPIVNQTVFGLCRMLIGAIAFGVNVAIELEEKGNSSTTWGNVKTELQGGGGYPLFPLGIGSVVNGAQGKVGNLIDWYLGRNASILDGDTYGLKWIITMTNGIIWPWDSTTVPQMI